MSNPIFNSTLQSAQALLATPLESILNMWIADRKFPEGTEAWLICDMQLDALMLSVIIPNPPLPSKKHHYPLYYGFEVENGDLSEWPKRVTNAFTWMRGQKDTMERDLPFTLKELEDAMEFIEGK